MKNFQTLQYLTKRYVLEFFGKVKNIKDQTGFELMTSRVLNALTHCTMLLRNNFGKEKIIVYISRKPVTI